MGETDGFNKSKGFSDYSALLVSDGNDYMQPLTLSQRKKSENVTNSHTRNIFNIVANKHQAQDTASAFR